MKVRHISLTEIPTFLKDRNSEYSQIVNPPPTSHLFTDSLPNFNGFSLLVLFN